MKREKKKCFECSGTGSVEKRVGGRGFFACSTEKMQVTCDRCNGTKVGDLESWRSAFDRNVNEVCKNSLKEGESISKFQYRFLASGLKGGTCAYEYQNSYGSYSVERSLVEMDGFLFVFVDSIFRDFMTLNGIETSYYNIKQAPSRIGTSIPLEDMIGFDGDLLKTNHWVDGEVDWDGAIQALQGILLTLKKIDPESPPLYRQFVPYKPGKVFIENGLLRGVLTPLTINIASINAVKYDPTQSRQVLSISFTGGVTTMRYNEGAEEAFDLITAEMAKMKTVDV